jgi:hypothetical protein
MTRSDLYAKLEANYQAWSEGWLQDDQYNHNVQEINRQLEAKSLNEWDELAKSSAAPSPLYVGNAIRNHRNGKCGCEVRP